MSIIAAIRTELDNGTRWTITNDEDKIVAAADTDVLWVDSLEALTDELNAIHGQSPSGLFYTRPLECYGGPIGRSVMVHNIPVYGGSDVTELAQHLATDNCDILVLNVIPSVALDQDIVIVSCVATLSSKKAASKRKAKATRDNKKHLNIQDLRNVCYPILNTISQVYDTHFEGIGRYTTTPRDAAKELRNTVNLFNAIFGPNSHRKIAAFQNAIENWKSRPAANEKVHAENKEFYDWMTEEAKAELPPVQTEWAGG